MAAALYVKGRHRHPDNSVVHFHLQITAAGLGNLGTDSEAELFKKIPDIDTFDAFGNANDQSVVITIRGIGEMQPDNPANQVRLDPELDEFGQPAASFPCPTQLSRRHPKAKRMWLCGGPWIGLPTRWRKSLPMVLISRFSPATVR